MQFWTRRPTHSRYRLSADQRKTHVYPRPHQVSRRDEDERATWQCLRLSLHDRRHARSSCRLETTCYRHAITVARRRHAPTGCPGHQLRSVHFGPAGGSMCAPYAPIMALAKNPKATLLILMAVAAIASELSNAPPVTQRSRKGILMVAVW